MARRAKKVTVLDDLTRRADKAQTRATKAIGRARKQAEKTLESGWKTTLDALPPPARKAVKETTGRIEKVVTDLDKRRAETLKAVEKHRKELVGRLTKESKAIAGRFSAPVFPGETIRTEMWRDGTVVSFRARVVERDVIALNNGRAEIIP